jgi:2'-5' RNA ligase
VGDLSGSASHRRWRLFIAHPVPEAVRTEIQAQLGPYRRRHPAVRWTQPESWHLTLLFLGAVDPRRVPELERLVDEIASQMSPYRAVVDHGDGLLRQGEGVAWLGLGVGSGTLIEAATLAAERCPRDATEGPAPQRTPSAHLTIVRRADALVIEALRSRTEGALGVSWTVDAVELVRSHLEPDGARYETLHLATM